MSGTLAKCLRVTFSGGDDIQAQWKYLELEEIYGHLQLLS